MQNLSTFSHHEAHTHTSERLTGLVKHFGVDDVTGHAEDAVDALHALKQLSTRHALLAVPLADVAVRQQHVQTVLRHPPRDVHQRPWAAVQRATPRAAAQQKVVHRLVVHLVGVEDVVGVALVAGGAVDDAVEEEVVVCGRRGGFHGTHRVGTSAIHSRTVCVLVSSCRQMNVSAR